jgi:hypothetical protein
MAISDKTAAAVLLADAEDSVLAVRDTVGDTPGNDLLLALEHIRAAASVVDEGVA